MNTIFFLELFPFDLSDSSYHNAASFQNTVYFNSWLLWHLLFYFLSFAPCFIIRIARVLTHYTISKFKCLKLEFTYHNDDDSSNLLKTSQNLLFKSSLI